MCSHAFPAVQELKLENLICSGETNASGTSLLLQKHLLGVSQHWGLVVSRLRTNYLIRKHTGPGTPWPSHHRTPLQPAFNLEYAIEFS